MEDAQFDALVRAHRDTVYRVALNCLGSPQEAEDAAQEVLLKCYLEDKDFLSPDHARNWLVRVTLNHCRSLLRTPWHRKTLPLEDWAPTLTFETREQSELFLAVMSLPARYRTVLYLFYYEDYSVSEIAALLHLRVTAVTTRLSRAREKLKDLWKEG